jgi:RNA polymerase sigma factor for flagellar operon FliA
MKAAESASTVNESGLDRNEALVMWYPMVERLAHRVAITYGLPPSVDTSDLVSCGVLGLAEAWGRYDPDRGVAFEAFAVPRVRGAIIDAIRAADWVPRKARQRARLTGEPVAFLGSLDEVTAGDGDSSMADRLVDNEAPQPGAALLQTENKAELLAALDRLPDREKMIITCYYFEGVQLQQVARSLGVTESRVSQLHTRALKLLRAALEAEAEAA